MIKLEKRHHASTAMAWLSPVLAAALTLISGAILFSTLGHPPLTALHAFFIAPLSDSFGWTELGVKVAPLLLCAVGLTLCYKANIWNIGAEGQLLAGALGGSVVALQLLNQTGFWVLPLVLIAGVLSGMLWAGIAALLKSRFHTNEILTTIMLNYIALNLLVYAVHGPLKDPEGFNFPQSALFSDSALLPVLLEESRLHIGILFAVTAAFILQWLIKKTLFGYQVKVTGMDERAARFAGFNQKQLIWIAFLVSGGLAGLAGVCEVTGPIGQLMPYVSPGYGYTAIIVVFLGRMHPIGIILASALLGLTYLGGENVQMEMQLPVSITGLFQGMLLFFLLACDVLILYRIRWINKNTSPQQALSMEVTNGS